MLSTFIKKKTSELEDNAKDIYVFNIVYKCLVDTGFRPNTIGLDRSGTCRKQLSFARRPTLIHYL